MRDAPKSEITLKNNINQLWLQEVKWFWFASPENVIIESVGVSTVSIEIFSASYILDAVVPYNSFSSQYIFTTWNKKMTQIYKTTTVENH